MKRVFTLLIALNLILSTNAQQEKILFSDAISLHLNKYNLRCIEAVENKDYKRVEFLFDSLVKNHLKGTFLEDLTIKKLNGGFFKTEEAKKPYLITTTTSWYIKNDEEIEAINTLAEEFDDQIDIVVLFWDTKKNIKKLSKRYSKSVILTYVDETSNMENSIINTYKHALGFPTVFYITSDKKIATINRGGMISFEKEPNESLYAANYNIYHKNLLQLLIVDSLSHDTILTDMD